MELPALALLLLTPLFSGLVVSQDDILPDGPLEALVGQQVVIKTLLSKPEFSFILWNFNNGTEQFHISTLGSKGLKTSPPYVGRVNISTDAHLTLTGLTRSDSGEYSLNILTESGATRTAEVELKVIDPVSDVLIKSNVPEAVELNSTVVLTCSARGSSLKFAWLNGTTAVVPDGTRVTVKDAATSSALSVSSVYRTDLAGPLFCSVSNSLSSKNSAAFNLSVFYGPEAVTISPANPPEVLASKSDFNLTCAALSSPAATFGWFRGDTPLEASAPVLTLALIEKQGLSKAKAQYSCKATNAKTKKALSATVSFAIIDPISGVKLSAPPEMLFAGNSSANLSCKAAEGLVEAVSWQKDGVALTSGGRVVVAADGSSVKIDPLQKEDNGVYTCTMSNSVGSKKDEVPLVVIHGPESVELSGDSEVEVNDPVKLECSSVSVPAATYTWKLNGTTKPLTTSDYIIDKVAYTDTGSYTCEAHNHLTGKTTTKSHFLSVKAEGELDEGLSDGAIAGIVIGVLAAVALAIGGFIYCRQKVPLESPY